MNKFISEIKYIWNALGQYKVWSLLLFFTILVSTILESISIVIFVPLLELMINQSAHGPFKSFEPILYIFSEIEPLHSGLIVVVVLIIVKEIFELIHINLATWFSSSIVNRWKIHLMETYLNATFSALTSTRQGVLLDHLFTQTSSAIKFIKSGIELISRLLLSIFLLLILHRTSPGMTIGLFLGGAIILLVSNTLIKNYSQQFGRKLLKLSQQSMGIAAESIAGIRQIKLFGYENTQRMKFTDVIKEAERLNVKNAVMEKLPTSFMEVVGSMFVAIVIILLKMKENDLSKIIPLIAVYVFVLQKISGSFSIIIHLKMRLSSSYPSFKLVNEICFHNEMPTEDLNKGESFLGLNDDIFFKDVFFSYSSNLPILQQFNFTIPLKKITALVGPSGSGKSTLVDLLMRLQNPTRGDILVNGKSLSTFNLISWRSKIGFVSQDIFIFNTSLFANIAMGKPNATLEEVKYAARIAQADSFIEKLPEQYQTVVGDRGIKLSGGQRQRIAIARALITDPEIIIFDEATSALDNECEAMINSTIQSLKGKKTILIIAHRSNAIKIADQVYDMTTK